MFANRRQTVFRHPLAAVGGALLVAGGALFVVLLMIDLTAASDNPYRALVTFIGAPFIITVGAVLLAISIFLQVRQARKEGRKVRFSLSIDPSDPAYVRNLWLFLGLSAVLILVVAYSGSRAYDATDSVAFCGETCHEVMEPQFVTYHNSPHAKVPCVDCHIGPGASFYVKSKLDGIRQLWATALNTYSKPIETPVENLRPAQETCEECHWPAQFYGEKMLTRVYYRTDEENSPWTIKMLMKIGGGNPRTGRAEGIHWHMIGKNRIEYVAADRKRQEIIWIRMVDENGDTLIYTDPGTDPPGFDDPETEIRRFDCMDCHNRPSHRFEPPATSINLAIANREISPELPYIREVGLELLNTEYGDRESAHDAIPNGLKQYYRESYPEIMDQRGDLVESAAQSLLDIYDRNFFPYMNTDYRVRENNLSHFVNNGCFRCHDEVKENQQGQTISADCSTCHVIVAQGPSEDPEQLDSDITGLEFQHPEEIDEAWRFMNCTDCHTPEQGY